MAPEASARLEVALTFGSIFFGMVRILPTQKDAASNLGRFKVWEAHRQAATLACARVWQVMRDAPDDLLAMSERNVLEDMLPNVGIQDPKPFYLLMIQSAMDAIQTGNMSATTPLRSDDGQPGGRGTVKV